MQTNGYMYGHDRQAHVWTRRSIRLISKQGLIRGLDCKFLGGLGPAFVVAKSGRTKSLMAPKGTLQPLAKSSLYKSIFSSYFQSAGQFFRGSDLVSCT
jgi:hypothetical protein